MSYFDLFGETTRRSIQFNSIQVFLLSFLLVVNKY
jgi:hypothetical protein